MKPIRMNKELGVKDLAALGLNPTAQSIKKSGIETIVIDKWCIYEDVNVKTGELQTLLSIMDKDGRVYTTNSATFLREFTAHVDLYESMGATPEKVNVIRAIAGKSQREYISCTVE